MAFAPKKIESFIIRELASIAEEGPVTMFKMYHISGDDMKSPMGEFPTFQGVVPSELAQEIFDHAQQHCDAMVTSRHERYGLESWIEARQGIRDHIVFMCTCNNVQTASFEPTDTPTERGKDQFAMRALQWVLEYQRGEIMSLRDNENKSRDAFNRTVTSFSEQMEATALLHDKRFEQEIARKRLQRQFDKEDAPPPRNALGEKLLEVGLPIFMTQVAKSFPGLKSMVGEPMADGRGPKEEDSAIANEVSRPSNTEESDLISILEILGESEALAMAKACQDPTKQAAVVGLVIGCFHPLPGIAKPSITVEAFLDYLGFEEATNLADACQDSTYQTAIRSMIESHFHQSTGYRSSVVGSQSESETENRKPKTGNGHSGHNQQGGRNGQSKEENQEASFQGSSQAEQGSSQKDASRPRKVSARTSAAEKVSRVVRPAQHASKKASSKGRKETNGKEGRKEGHRSSVIGQKGKKTENRKPKTENRKASYA